MDLIAASVKRQSHYFSQNR